VDERTRALLRNLATTRGTPSYVYFPDRVIDGIAALERAFGDRFTVSYAIKCNPNRALLAAIRRRLDHVDASSIGEVERGIAAGYAPEHISFSGPAKRAFEIDRAVALGVGAIVCESEDQIAAVDASAARQGKQAAVLLRINPRNVPKRFGLHMAGRAGQFGVDEEDCDGLLESLAHRRHLVFDGFHIFSGGNSLDAAAIAENFGIFIELFERFSSTHRLRPRRLIFGSGFGIPYFDSDRPLDLDDLAARINPMLDDMRRSPWLGQARCMLEMGRFLTGPHGYLLTSVVAAKHSRGTRIRMCDAGFNNHLSACGMMGTVIRRNWRIVNLREAPRAVDEYLLVGPLCASFDQLAAKIELPETAVGDLLAVETSGAYGLTASPTRFISHPEPREYLIFEAEGHRIVDATESSLNSPADVRHLPEGALSR
jgi:diaminopimelate decarboxylase